MDLQIIHEWALAVGDQYGVNPMAFAIVYFGGFPFLGLSMVWLVRNRRLSRPVHLPLLSATAFSMAAYVYVIVAGENIPVWIYGMIVVFVAFGSWKMLQMVTGPAEA
jgi:hypothetical protein